MRHDIRRLTSDLQTMADWKDDLAARLRIAELCFQTIGLSEGRREALIHESECFTRACRALAEESTTWN